MSNKEYHKSIMSKTSLTDVLDDYKHIAESIVDDATYQSADTGVLLYHLGSAIKYLEELDTLRKAFEMACDNLELYERGMFPHTAISSAIFKIALLKSATDKVGEENE